MESEAGEDLFWWWRGWHFNNWRLDLALSKVAELLMLSPQRQCTWQRYTVSGFLICYRKPMRSHISERTPFQSGCQDSREGSGS